VTPQLVTARTPIVYGATAYRENPKGTLSEQIRDFFGGGRCFLFAKGRVGLYAGLRAMALPRGAKVLLPGYTCMVVPLAIQAAGLAPVYVDVDPRTYNLDPGLLESGEYDDVGAVLVQHTYGIPCEMGAIESWCEKRRVPIIEDCCHAFGSTYGGRLCGTLGVFAFMSGQWNKPFSTGLGGMLLLNDAPLAERVEELVRREAAEPGVFRNLLLSAQIVAHALLVRPRTSAWATRVYRLLTRWGIVAGSSSNEELAGRVPRKFFALMAPCQVRKGLREMARARRNIDHRRELTAWYRRKLRENGLAAGEPPGREDLPLVRYPLRVANKGELLRLSARAGVELGSWFESPLHPAGTRLDDFGYRLGSCPHGEAAAAQVVNLPTHLRVNRAAAERTLRFLTKHAQPIR